MEQAVTGPPPTESPLGSADADADADAITASKAEPERFTEIFDRYFAEVYGYVARRVGEQAAEDIAAETFLVAFRRRERYEDRIGTARPWLYGIATNLMRRQRRHEIRHYRALARMQPVRAAAEHEELVASRVTAEQACGELADALRRLSPGDRDVLLLVALAGLTYDEVAAALGVAYGTVCSRLSRARQKLRAALDGIDPMLAKE
jgi:RNA polymerase sigma factor (sigma-70 family)